HSGRDIEYADIFYEKIDNALVYFYQTLIKNYENRYAKDDEGNNYKLSISDRVYHIETFNQFDNYQHTKESGKENATQHLGKDIAGNYFILNLNFGGMDAHGIVAITAVLYFYEYIYSTNHNLINTNSKDIKLEFNQERKLSLEANHQTESEEYKALQTFLEKHYEIDSHIYKEIKQVIAYCNIIALSIHRILRNIEIEKYEIRLRKSGVVDSPNLFNNDMIRLIEANKINIPNWIYATIDKILFEATIKTDGVKKVIQDNASEVIDGILYLQDNEVYIKILTKDEIQSINADSALSNLFAIHETIFFTSADKEGKPLINNNEVANKLIGYITPRTQIFCTDLKDNSKDTIIKCYINETLKYYPESIR
ncbi:hypothetical protein CQA53_11545, partial [Helicobacter didelphidarum]